MKLFRHLGGASLAVLLPVLTAHAQTDYFFVPTGTATWNSNANWENANGQNFQPEAGFNDRAVVNNGGTAFVDNGSTPAPGAIILGQSALGGGGNLEIRSGGNFNVNVGVSQVGEDPLDGGILVGNDGIGTLTVLPGGTLTAAGPLTSGSAAGNTVTVGAAAGAGVANLTAASASLAGTTRVFPNGNFNSNDSLAFAASSNYIAEISGSNSGSINATGAADLAGSLTASFAGTPAVGSSWPLIEASGFNGAFGSVGSNAALASGQSLFLSTTDLGGGRERLDLNLAEVLVLEVNRNTGVATIRQPGSTTIELDGYSILSSEGSLRTDGWNSLQSQGALGGGWTESNPAAGALSELKAVGSGSLSAGASVAVGSVYDPFVVPFGFTGSDLSFEYTTPSGAIFDGIVELTGTLANNLVLQIDPVTGEGRIRNSSNTDISLDAYTIESASGSLTSASWDSLSDQGSAGGDWLELFGPPNDEEIGEFKPSGGAAMGPSGDAVFGLGQIFDSGAGLRDLVFQYKQDGQLTGALGTVVYQTIDDNPADLDLNGRVNGRDFLLTQRTGASIPVWEANFGVVEGVGGANPAVAAIPEPATATVLLFAVMVSSLGRGARRAVGRK